MKLSRAFFFSFVQIFFIPIFAFSQSGLPAGTWQAQAERADGHHIMFTLKTGNRNGKPVAWLVNAKEKILISDIRFTGDSVLFYLPFFEAEFRTVFHANNLKGVYRKRLEDDYQVMPFSATLKNANRFNGVPMKKGIDISGRYKVVFGERKAGDSTYSVGEFLQRENHVTGTFLNTDGDYRYLEGIISGDTLKLSCFDGGHAYLFTAIIKSNHELTNGKRYSGPEFSENWFAVRNTSIRLPDEFSLTHLKPGEHRLQFRFRSTDGKEISLSDERFRNKVVIIQIMGSWCPNCMDETQFLAPFYQANKSKGVEIVGLAYERSTDFERSVKSLRSFQDRFHIEYPILITGVTVNDPKRTEKTLPQLQEIIAFPTTIFIGRDGKVAKIHSGFSGPGTGAHYEAEKRTIAETVKELLGSPAGNITQ